MLFMTLIIRKGPMEKGSIQFLVKSPFGRYFRSNKSLTEDTWTAIIMVLATMIMGSEVCTRVGLKF